MNPPNLFERRQTLQSLMEKGNKGNIFDEALNILKTSDNEKRTEEEIEILVKATEDMEFFKNMNKKKKNVENELHQKCCRRLKYEFHPKGTAIVNIGEQARKFYIILDGAVNILLPKTFNDIHKLFNEYKSSYPNIYEEAIIRELRQDETGDSPINNYITSLPLNKSSNIGNPPVFDQYKLVQMLSEHISYTKLTGGIEWSDLHELHKFFKDGIFTFSSVGIVGKGCIFGELAFILKKPRAATVVTQQDTELAVMEKEDYEEILLQLDEKKMSEKIDFFAKLMSQDVTKDTVTKFSYLFDKKKFFHNQIIFKEGDSATHFYIVRKGEVTLHKEIQLNRGKQKGGNEHSSYVDIFWTFFNKKLKKTMLELETILIGGFFGNEILLDVPKYYATAIIKSSKATVYMISKEKLMKSLSNMLGQKKIFIEKTKIKLSWMMNTYDQLSKFINLKEKDRDSLLFSTKQTQDYSNLDQINKVSNDDGGHIQEISPKNQFKINNYTRYSQNRSNFESNPKEILINNSYHYNQTNQELSTPTNNRHPILTHAQTDFENFKHTKDTIMTNHDSLKAILRHNRVLNLNEINLSNEKTIKLLMKQSKICKNSTFMDINLHMLENNAHLKKELKNFGNKDGNIGQQRKQNKSQTMIKKTLWTSPSLQTQKQSILSAKDEKHFESEIYITSFGPTNTASSIPLDKPKPSPCEQHKLIGLELPRKPFETQTPYTTRTLNRSRIKMLGNISHRALKNYTNDIDLSALKNISKEDFDINKPLVISRKNIARTEQSPTNMVSKRHEKSEKISLKPLIPQHTTILHTENNDSPDTIPSLWISSDKKSSKKNTSNDSKTTARYISSSHRVKTQKDIPSLNLINIESSSSEVLSAVYRSVRVTKKTSDKTKFNHEIDEYSKSRDKSESYAYSKNKKISKNQKKLGIISAYSIKSASNILILDNMNKSNPKLNNPNRLSKYKTSITTTSTTNNTATIRTSPVQQTRC